MNTGNFGLGKLGPFLICLFPSGTICITLNIITNIYIYSIDIFILKIFY